MTFITEPDRIAFAQMLARRAALKLELKGMTRHGRSMYVVCKEAYDLKGSRQRVLDQLDALVNSRWKEIHAAGIHPIPADPQG